MREIVFKNLTSQDRNRKIIISDETFEKSGVRTHISRHLICIVRRVYSEEKVKQLTPSLHVIKEVNHLKQTERFFFKLKGSIYAVAGGNLYLLTFLHSLRIQMVVLDKQPLDLNG